jgi:hypothetical protein
MTHLVSRFPGAQNARVHRRVERQSAAQHLGRDHLSHGEHVKSCRLLEFSNFRSCLFRRLFRQKRWRFDARSVPPLHAIDSKTRVIGFWNQRRAARRSYVGARCCGVYLVPGGGIEPPRCFHRRILSPLRLPVPPSRLDGGRIIAYVVPSRKRS